MKLEHLSQKQLEKDLIDIIEKQINISQYQIFFFGSRVTGRGNDRSDIDVGIEGKKPIDFSRLSRIKADIENIRTLYKIDVVDFSDAGDNFKQVAKEKIEIIYPK